MKGKDMVLLGREEPPNRVSSIQEIIRNLHEEIARGEAVYTADEIRLLEKKLADYEQTVRSLSEP